MELLEFTTQDDPRDLPRKIQAQQPRAVGFSCYLWNRPIFEEAARRLRESSQVILFAGGAEVTASAESMAQTGLFDYLLPGEGEASFLQLLPLLQKGRPGGCQILPSRPLADLAESPSPVIQGTLDPADYHGMLWELSRGCPFQCAFCCESRGVQGVRSFDEERLRAELTAFRRRGTEQIFVLDPTFNISKARALRLLALFREVAPDIHFTLEVRAELIDQELAAALSGLYGSLQIGLQSADPAVMEKLNRRFDSEAFQRGIAFLNTFGAAFGLDLIYGLPGDTLDGFRKSLDFALFQLPNHLDIFRLSIFPGTQLYEEAAALGLTFEDAPPYHVQGRPGFSQAELEKAHRLADAADLFYNRGRAAGWFLGITEALGMRPSAFLERFAEDSSPGTPHPLQQAWLERIFPQKRRGDLLPAARDFCLFHHLYGQVMHDPRGTPAWGLFHYDPLEIGEAGIPDLEEFAQAYPPPGEAPHWGGFFFLSPQGVEVMRVSPYHIQLLEKIRDGQPQESALPETAALTPEFSVQDLREFLLWMEESGLSS